MDSIQKLYCATKFAEVDAYQLKIFYANEFDGLKVNMIIKKLNSLLCLVMLSTFVYGISLNFIEIQSETINVREFIKNNNCNDNKIENIERNTFFTISIKFIFHVCTDIEKKTKINKTTTKLFSITKLPNIKRKFVL